MDLIEKVSALWAKFMASPDMTLGLIVSVVIFTLMYYYLLRFLVNNKAGAFAILFVAVMIVSAAIITLVSTMANSIYLLIPAIFLFLTFILYSVEIKRIIWAKTNLNSDSHHGERTSYDQEKIQKCITEIIKALQNMSKNDVGAIIILSTGNVPSQIIDSGVKLESDISSELIESVFFPKTPLHDGAMIINDTKIVAAGCFLPLSQNLDNIPKGLGTRHRAGIGVTETIDVISFIVSEETGIISIAKGGKITRYADTAMLKKTLSDYYWQGLESGRR
ncbi:MAG: diadenylate cyclase [Clostridia bacterium]|nr:diadenylate cyclase [Clostridia bacterium]